MSRVEKTLEALMTKLCDNQKFVGLEKGEIKTQSSDSERSLLLLANSANQVGEQRSVPDVLTASAFSGPTRLECCIEGSKTYPFNQPAPWKHIFF